MALAKQVWNQDSQVFPLPIQTALLAWLRIKGANIDQLLVGTGIRMEEFANPDRKISYLTLRKLVSNAKSFWGSPDLGLAFGQNLSLSSLSLVEQTALACETPRAACVHFLKFLHLKSAILNISLVHTRDSMTFVYKCVTPEAESERFFVDAGLSVTIRYLEFLLGEDVVACATLEQDNGGYSAAYDALFNEGVEFNQSQNTVTVFHNGLDELMPSADPFVYESGNKQCESRLNAIEQRQSISEIVRQHIDDKISDPPSLGEIASRIAMSPRSLRRYLNRQNLTYRDCLNSVRAKHAKFMLQDPNISITEISEFLNYDSPANFNRAFKRWYDMSPSEYRTIETGS